MSEPQSRNEAILQATLDGTAYTDPPQSRIESLLLQLKAAIETGGGGGDTTVLAAKVAAIEAQLFSTIADVPTNTDTGSMDLNSVDLNTITTSGFYNAITCTNAPASYCTLVVVGYYVAGYCAQIAVDVSTGKLHTRTQTNGTWGTWETKPSTTDLAAVATSGAYSDLSGRPTLAAVATSGAYNDLSGRPTLAAVATSGDYDDLSGTPNLATVATSGRYADLTGKPTVDTAISGSSTNAVQNRAISAALADKADSSALAEETTARENADTALQTAIDGKVPLGIGTPIQDPDPTATPPVYADLFSLPVGKYHRQNNVTNTQNLPAGMTAPFYCEIVNTISTARKKIYLYPATATTAGTYYTCLETSTGYGAWYKFTGEEVTAAATANTTEVKPNEQTA